jgi:hypothetical protein
MGSHVGSPQVTWSTWLDQPTEIPPTPTQKDPNSDVDDLDPMAEDKSCGQTPTQSSTSNTPQLEGTATSLSGNAGTPAQSHPRLASSSTGHNSGAVSHLVPTRNAKRRRGLGIVTPNACTECRKKRAKVSNAYWVAASPANRSSAMGRGRVAVAKARKTSSVNTRYPCDSRRRTSAPRLSPYDHGRSRAILFWPLW